MKNILAANLAQKKEFNLMQIFSHPVYERMIGLREEVDKVFDNRLEDTVKNFESMVKI